jgi:selenoprotein W-related protein
MALMVAMLARLFCRHRSFAASSGGVSPQRRSIPSARRRTMLTVPRTPRLEIEYCTQCRWLLRAGWMAQELLTTFQAELGEVALIPGTGGILDVRLDGAVVWSRAAEGRFPELKELKQRVRDTIAPGRSLGHSDG